MNWKNTYWITRWFWFTRLQNESVKKNRNQESKITLSRSTITGVWIYRCAFAQICTKPPIYCHRAQNISSKSWIMAFASGCACQETQPHLAPLIRMGMCSNASNVSTIQNAIIHQQLLFVFWLVRQNIRYMYYLECSCLLNSKWNQGARPCLRISG